MSIDSPAQAADESPAVAISLHQEESRSMSVMTLVAPPKNAEPALVDSELPDNSDEPQIISIRKRSTLYKPEEDDPNAAEDSEAGRGRVGFPKAEGISARAARKKKRQSARKSGPNSVGVDHADPDEPDFAKRDFHVYSPIPRNGVLAGVSPHIRAASPAVSNLKLQLDALNLGSRPGSRATSVAPSKPGTDTPYSEVSATTDPSTEEMVSYEIPLDQDFISEETGGQKANSQSTACLDQQTSSRLLSRKMTAADFTTLKCLGKGTYGTVHLVKQKTTNRLFAQKQFRKASLTVHKKLVEQTKTERNILESVNRHPFIVNLYYAFQDCQKLYLILEYAQGGELFHHLQEQKVFKEDTAAFYMAEMILALDHLHHNVGVVYRDLKPENCLLDAEGHLLLTDFGLSKVSVEDPGTPGSSRCNSTGIGTIEYMAPEVIRGSDVSAIGPGYERQCDWWSLGALGVDLLTGSPPFPGNNYTKIQQNIMTKKLNLPYYLSLDAKELLNRFLRKDPGKRLGARGRHDVALMKRSRFFRKIDWVRLESRELEAPIKPLITNPELAENFSTEFTNLAFSQGPVVDDSEGVTGVTGTDPFGGFSFVASSSLLETNYIESTGQ